MEAMSDINGIEQTVVKVKKTVLKEQGNITPESLYQIITKKDGKPDLLAIDIYIEARSWFKLKRTKVNGNVIHSSKLKGHGWQIGYEYFSKKYGCTSETIRTKLVLLEKLELLSRDFRTEYFYSKRFNNLMYLLVWKDTPHFYSEIGLEKTSTPIQKNLDSYPENQGHLSKNSLTPIQKNLDIIYVIPNNDPREEQESSRSSLGSSPKYIPVIECNNTHAREPELSSHADGLLTQPAQDEILSEPNQVDKSDHLNKPKLLTASEKKPNIQEEISIMKPEEPPLSKKETRKMLLSKAIFDAFGATANEIQDNCTFEELEPDKVGIKPGVGVSFNDIEKAKIRRCIKAVYGEEVTILAAIPKPMVTLAKMDNESGLAKGDVGVSVCQNPQWLCLRSNLVKALQKWYEGKYAEHILKNWFDRLSVSPESSREKLILIGESSVIHRIDETYISATEQAVLASNFEVELRYEGNRERPIILTKEMINRG